MSYYTLKKNNKLSPFLLPVKEGSPFVEKESNFSNRRIAWVGFVCFIIVVGLIWSDSESIVQCMSN
jgi:hypothetical protein